MQSQQEQNYWQPGAAAPDEDNGTTDASSSTEPQPLAPDGNSKAITWQASEFIHHEKGGNWFLILLGFAAILLAVDVFVVQSWTFGALIIVMTIAATVVGRRPPRTLEYSLSLQGIRINDRLLSFHDFRAFGVVQEGALYSIRLIPNRRFMPMVSLYFPADQGEKIVDLIGSVLPMEHIERDAIDKLVEKIRF